MKIKELVEEIKKEKPDEVRLDLHAFDCLLTYLREHNNEEWDPVTRREVMQGGYFGKLYRTSIKLDTKLSNWHIEVIPEIKYGEIEKDKKL